MKNDTAHFILSLCMTTAIALSATAQQWTAPVVPGADLDNLKSSTTVYLCNVETDAFLTSGMTWNTNAIAIRLPGGDTKAASAFAANAFVSSGKVRFRLANYSSYFISCLSEAANNIYVDQNSNYQFAYEEDPTSPRVYTLTNVAYSKPLDVTWDYGGHLTITDGGGHTRWAFIPADSITSGAYARYKARRALWRVQEALVRSGKAAQFGDALAEAQGVYDHYSSSVSELQAAARTLFTTCAGVLEGPLDVSFLFTNADMLGTATAKDWTTASVSFSEGEFEMYHKTLTLSQTQQVPVGIYDVVMHALYRNDGSDAAPQLTASGASVAIPRMNDINFSVGNTNGSNGWTSGTSGLIPDNMRACAQALTHTEATARAENVIVQDGTLTITASVNSNKQWFNWQGFEIIWKGSDDSALRDALWTAIADAEAVVGKGSGKGADVLQEKIDYARAVYNNKEASMTELTTLRTELADAIEEYRYIAASPDFPYDVTTRHIANPDFEAGLSDWTNVGMAAQGNSSFTFKHGGTYVEKWVSAAGRLPEVSVTQTITDLPCGNYLLKAAAHHIVEKSSTAQRGVVIIAGTHEKTVTVPAEYDVMFTHLGQPVTIGLQSTKPTGNWIACDNFRLYYIGGEMADYTAELSTLKTEAEALLTTKANATSLAALQAAVTQADEAIAAADISTYAPAATALEDAMLSVRTSAAAYEALASAITTGQEVCDAGQEAGRTDFLVAIATAQALYNSADATEDALYEAVETLKEATFAYRLAGGSGTPPTVVTDKRYARGSTIIFGRNTVTPASGTRIIERGFCWSQSPEPTVLDNRSSVYLSNNGSIYKMEGLQPATRYYVRAYAISDTYAVGYGDVLKVYTIPAGTVTWTYNNGGPADANERINAALKGGVDYWNRFTSIRGLRISCSYGSGTPTADCSYGGSMRIGPSSSYQQIGTVLHEMAHAAGVGTHPVWYDCAALRTNVSRGDWLGDRTTDVLRFWDNDNTARLTGDDTHMWPYGINGAHEDDGTEVLYTAQSLLMQALGEDGLPPTGGFCTPAYVLDQEDTIRYYLRSESPACGLNTMFLTENRLRSLRSVAMTPEEAAANDSCAWNITFNPATGYYQFRNVATGHYLTYSTTSGSSSFKLIQKDKPTSTESFHLIRGRVDAKMEAGNDVTLPVRGYWIIHPESKQNPTCLSANSTGGVGTASFNLANSATTQRWVILPEATLATMIRTAVTPQEYVESESSNSEIFDLSGRQIDNGHLERGIYIFNSKKIFIR